MRRLHRFPLLLAGVLLAACEARVDVDLSTTGATSWQALELQVAAVRLLREDGTLESIAVPDPAVDELLAYADGGLKRLLEDAELPEGRYIGLALSFDSSADSLTDATGATQAIDTSLSDRYAPIDLSVSRGDEVALVVGFDARLSLSDPTTDGGAWTLAPQLYVLPTDRALTLAGAVAASLLQAEGCLDEGVPAAGAALYVFEGSVTPRDADDGATPVPLFSVPVKGSSAAGYAYAVSFIAPGNYTLALSCTADEDDPLQDDSMRFLAQRNVSLTSDLAGVDLD